MESIHILLVDDDPLIRDMISQILLAQNFLVETAENGQQGFEKFKVNPQISLVVTDLNMPLMNGLELIKKIRETTNSEVPVVVLSGNNEVSVAIDAINRGANEYLLKDENMENALGITVERALERKRIVDQNRKLIMENTIKNMELKDIVDTMTQIGMAITAERDFPNLMDVIISNSRTLTHADAGTLYLVEGDHLVFKIVQNETLNIHMGGKAGEEVHFPKVKIAESNVSGFVVINKTTVNIPDVYESELFDFTGPKKFDETSGYRSKSMLVVPMINREMEVVGVLQLLNAKDPNTDEVVPFSYSNENLIKSLASQAAIAVSNLKFKEQTEQLLDEVVNIKNYNESILESMTNGVITLDSKNHIAKCNYAASRIFKTRTDKIINQNAEDFFEGKNSWILMYVKSVLETHNQALAMDTELVVGNNDVVPVNLAVVPLNNSKRELIGTMLMLEDITAEKRVRGTLARYMTKEVAEKLLESGEAILGGQIQEASVLFSDIRGFTSISERLGANETVVMLNEYFTLMVEIIFEYSGILDKYIGDAILAVFGAPFSGPKDTDNAVKASIGMMQALKEFNARRIQDKLDPIDIGIGINTDEVLAGNIGSIKRMDYTCIGDGVNLASRLEGVNKYFNTNILISENTYRKLKGEYRCREIDSIRVKGKNKPVGIYEVLDYHDETSYPNLKECLDLFKEGVNFYRQRKWMDGKGRFEQVLVINGNDKASKMYSLRCQFLQDNPPEENWDGVWTMESK